MNRTKNTVLCGILFVFVFIYVGKNSNLRGTRRYFISLKIAWILMFGWLDPANAKDNPIIPGAHGFKPPISRRNPNFNNPALGGARQNTGKGLSPGPNKPPRAPSGFRTSHKPVKNKGFMVGQQALVAVVVVQGVPEMIQIKIILVLNHQINAKIRIILIRDRKRKRRILAK